jgi:hypothetical protein
MMPLTRNTKLTKVTLLLDTHYAHMTAIMQVNNGDNYM